MSLLWHVVSFVAGFAGGFVVAWWMRHAGLGRGDIARTLAGLLIVAVVGYAVISTYAATAELRRATECQQARNAEFASALEVRADVTAAGNAAQRKFLTALATGDLPAAERAAAFREYLAALDRIDAVRSDRPLIVGGCP